MQTEPFCVGVVMTDSEHNGWYEKRRNGRILQPNLINLNLWKKL